MTAWIAFTDSTPENGCLRVMPKTHLGPDLPHEETYAADNMLARGQTIQGLDENAAVDIRLSAGQFSMHHERMAHGSLANRTNDRRMGFAFFYIPTHVRSTLGRRTALLVRGVDTYHHWDAEPLPQSDLDPVAFDMLKSVWGQYRDGAYSQAAEAAIG